MDYKSMDYKPRGEWRGFERVVRLCRKFLQGALAVRFRPPVVAWASPTCYALRTPGSLEMRSGSYGVLQQCWTVGEKHGN